MLGSRLPHIEIIIRITHALTCTRCDGALTETDAPRCADVWISLAFSENKAGDLNSSKLDGYEHAVVAGG